MYVHAYIFYIHSQFPFYFLCSLPSLSLPLSLSLSLCLSLSPLFSSLSRGGSTHTSVPSLTSLPSRTTHTQTQTQTQTHTHTHTHTDTHTHTHQHTHTHTHTHTSQIKS